ncbi:MAG: 3-dehydro-L-gulonate 2-dehydrogenase [Chitinophagaceae bacterium]
MNDQFNTVLIPAVEMQLCFENILLNKGFKNEKATQIASVFTANSVDGVYTHGVNRFPRFIEYTEKRYIQKDAAPLLKSKFNGIEQWDGSLGPGISNAIFATNQCMKLANGNGIGCVTLSNTNHWMRGGTYGWQATRAGYVFIGWTNTIANMPAWGATDARLGNNPLVIALPYNNDAIVLDMAMSQYSFGAMELSVMKKEKLPVYGGFDSDGNMTDDPASILASKRPIPVGYWKGAGLSLLLDILATILSGGLSTQELSKQEAEYGLSQVFVAIDIAKLPGHSMIPSLIESIITDYKQSIPKDAFASITYPGERVLQTRERNLSSGIPVMQQVWDAILKL